MDRARQDPAVRACLLTLQTLGHDLTDALAGLLDVALVLLPLNHDRDDPEPLQTEHQRRSVSLVRGSQCG